MLGIGRMLRVALVVGFAMLVGITLQAYADVFVYGYAEEETLEGVDGWRYNYGLYNSASYLVGVENFTIEFDVEATDFEQPSGWYGSWLGTEKLVIYDYTAGSGHYPLPGTAFLPGFTCWSTGEPAAQTFEVILVDGTTYTGKVLGGIPVELSSFTVTAGDREVILDWTAHSETENLGFNIYRSTSEDGDYIKVNSQIIPGAQGGSSQTRRDYSYVDEGLVNGVTYYYKLEDVDFQGNREVHGPLFVAPYAGVLASADYALSQNYPNPFNPETGIRYQIARDGQVILRIYNVVGHLVRTLVDRTQVVGSYTVYWDGRDDSGEALGDGVYLYSLKANGYMATKKMLLVR